MKLGSVCYLPPRGVDNAPAFFEHLQNFPPEYELVFCSDSNDWDDVVQTEKVKSPEVTKRYVAALGSRGPKPHPDNVWTVPKYAFMQVVDVAKKAGFHYFLVVETDCRFSMQKWDKFLFDLFLPTGAMVGGTIYVSNPFNSSKVFSEAYTRWLMREYKKIAADNYSDNRIPRIITYGDTGGVCGTGKYNIWPNGALCILNTQWASAAFPINALESQSISGTAYDSEIGIKLLMTFGEEVVFDYVTTLPVFSYYGNTLYNEPDRITMIANKQVVGAHQIKGAWVR